MKISSTLSLFLVFTLSAMASAEGIRKRIVLGDAAFSHDEWKTYHAVVIAQTWTCSKSNQMIHELGGCQQTPFCSGTMLTVEFIITACHCVMYLQFFERPGLYDDTVGFFTHIYYFIFSPKIHSFYSTYAILAGSTDINTMNQKRHAEMVFPHPYYDYKPDKYEFPGGFNPANQDIALVRVCEPFHITQTVKPAPIMRLTDLRTHYDSLIKRASVCLLAGYGRREDPYNHKNLIESGFLRFTWGFLDCPKYCVGHHSKCIMCLRSISPRYGTANVGDSGSPILCDGSVIGITTWGEYDPAKGNDSFTGGYPFYCIKNAITPQRLAQYRTVLPNGMTPEYLGPVGDQE